MKRLSIRKANGNPVLLPWYLRSRLRGGDDIFFDRSLAGGAGKGLALAGDFALAIGGTLAVARTDQIFRPGAWC